MTYWRMLARISTNTCAWRTFFGGWIAMADLGVIEICCTFPSPLSPFMDLRRACRIDIFVSCSSVGVANTLCALRSTPVESTYLHRTLDAILRCLMRQRSIRMPFLEDIRDLAEVLNARGFIKLWWCLSPLCTNNTFVLWVALIVWQAMTEDSSWTILSK